MVGRSASAQLAAEIKAARGNGVPAGGGSRGSSVLDPATRRVATAYGVERSVRREEQARRQEGGGGGHPASGWRRTSELEKRLRASEEAQAASKLQVALLREELRRKGSRVSQLEKLISMLEEHNRSLAARLRCLDSEREGGAPEPLPAFAAQEIDDAVTTALMATQPQASARPCRRRSTRPRTERGAAGAAVGASGFLGWVDGKGEVAAGLDGGLDGGGGSDADDCDDDYDDDYDAADDGRGGARRGLAWTAARWVASLDLQSLVSACLLRHLRAHSDDSGAELPFVSKLGERASKVHAPFASCVRTRRAACGAALACALACARAPCSALRACVVLSAARACVVLCAARPRRAPCPGVGHSAASRRLTRCR